MARFVIISIIFIQTLWNAPRYDVSVILILNLEIL